jgi:hypothetical protein
VRQQTAHTRRQQPLDGEPVARVLVAGASGLAGALAAELVWRHPRLELVAVSARSDADPARPPRSAVFTDVGTETIVTRS